MKIPILWSLLASICLAALALFPPVYVGRDLLEREIQSFRSKESPYPQERTDHAAVLEQIQSHYPVQTRQWIVEPATRVVTLQAGWNGRRDVTVQRVTRVEIAWDRVLLEVALSVLLAGLLAVCGSFLARFWQRSRQRGAISKSDPLAHLVQQNRKLKLALLGLSREPKGGEVFRTALKQAIRTCPTAITRGLILQQVGRVADAVVHGDSEAGLCDELIAEMEEEKAGRS